MPSATSIVVGLSLKSAFFNLDPTGMYVADGVNAGNLNLCFRNLTNPMIVVCVDPYTDLECTRIHNVGDSDNSIDSNLHSTSRHII